MEQIQPDGSDTGSYEVIHLGQSAAVVGRAEDWAAIEEWEARERAGTNKVLSD